MLWDWSSYSHGYTVRNTPGRFAFNQTVATFWTLFSGGGAGLCGFESSMRLELPPNESQQSPRSPLHLSADSSVASLHQEMTSLPSLASPGALEAASCRQLRIPNLLRQHVARVLALAASQPHSWQTSARTWSSCKSLLFAGRPKN